MKNQSPEWMGFADAIWYTGVVEDIKDPVEIGRVKVRIHGLHAQDYQTCPTDALPWAQQMMPVTSGSHGGVGQSPTGLQVGSWVVGILLDGARAQFPLVLGTLHGKHANQSIPSEGGGQGAGASSGFGPQGAVNGGGSGGSGGIGAGGGGGGGSKANFPVKGYNGNRATVQKKSIKANQAANLGLRPNDKLSTVTSPSGVKFTVNQKVAPQFQGFLNDLEGTGYKINAPYAGNRGDGYNYRNVRGSGKLSQHAYGNAIDINPGSNGLGSRTSDLPANIETLAARHGLTWGGNFSRPDAMHFEASTAMPSGYQNNLSQLPGNSWNPSGSNLSPAQGAAAAAGRAGDESDVMQKYTNEDTSLPQTSKSPSNPEGTTKEDRIEAEKNQNREKGIPTAGDGSSWDEPCPPDIGTYPNVQTTQDPAGNKEEKDSTPNGNRIQNYHASGSYQETDHNGNFVHKSMGDFMAYSKRNVRLASENGMSLGSKLGDVRIHAGAELAIESTGRLSLAPKGDFDISADGAITLKASGGLVIDAQSVKINASGGAIDMRAGDEINLEAGANMNIQSGAEMALESAGAMFQHSHGTWDAKAEGEAALGSGGDVSLKSGGNVRLQGGEIHCKAATTKADLFESPNPPKTPDPVGAGQAPNDAKDPQTGLTSKKNKNAQVSRDLGSAGGGTAAHAEAGKIDPERKQPSGNSAQPEEENRPAPRPCFKDPSNQAKDASSSAENNNETGGNPGETDQAWYGQPTGNHAVEKGVGVAKAAGRDVQSGGKYHPSKQDVADIAEANKHTGGGSQTQAGNVARDALESGSSAAAGAKNQQVKYPLSEAEKDFMTRVVAGEARGEPFKGQVGVAEVMFNRQNSPYRYLKGGNIIDTISKPNQFSVLNSGRGGNRAYINNLSRSDPAYIQARKAVETAQKGTNYTNGALYYSTHNARSSQGNVQNYQGGDRLNIGGHTFAKGSAEGGFNASGLPFSDGDVSVPDTVDIPEGSGGGVGKRISNNMRMNNTANVIRGGGIDANLAESSVLSTTSPRVAQSWGQLKGGGLGWKSLNRIIKEHPEHAPAIKELLGKGDKYASGNQSIDELIRMWINTYFSPYKALGASSFKTLGGSHAGGMLGNFNSLFPDVINGFSKLTDFIPNDLQSKISGLVDNIGNKNSDGKILGNNSLELAKMIYGVNDIKDLLNMGWKA